MQPNYTPTHIGRDAATIAMLVQAFSDHLVNTRNTIPDIHYSLDVEFFNGTYPDSELTHATLGIPGTTVLLEFPDQEARVAFSQAWYNSALREFTAYLHFGQDDLLLLMREGIEIGDIYDTGTVANHLSLKLTALKDVAKEYKQAEVTTSYWALLKKVIPPEFVNDYIRGSEVIKAYDLRRVTDPEKQAIVNDYCGQDVVLGYLVGEHFRKEVMPRMYDADTLEIIYKAQFGSAIYLAQHNLKGYPIDEASLRSVIKDFQAEVDDLEKTGRQMVRDAMGWDNMPSALDLLNPVVKRMPLYNGEHQNGPDPGYRDISNTPRTIRMLSDGTWISTDPERPDNNEQGQATDENSSEGVLPGQEQSEPIADHVPLS